MKRKLCTGWVFLFFSFPQWIGLGCHFGRYSIQCRCTSIISTDKILWAFRIYINTGQFSQWLPKDLGVPGSLLLISISVSNFLQCFFRALQEHAPIMMKEQSTESKTESTGFCLYKTSTEIRDFFRTRILTKEKYCHTGQGACSWRCCGFWKAPDLPNLFCKPQGAACHAAVLLPEAEAPPLSAAPVWLKVSLKARFRLHIGTREWGPSEQPFQGVFSLAS